MNEVNWKNSSAKHVIAAHRLGLYCWILIIRQIAILFDVQVLRVFPNYERKSDATTRRTFPKFMKIFSLQFIEYILQLTNATSESVFLFLTKRKYFSFTKRAQKNIPTTQKHQYIVRLLRKHGGERRRLCVARFDKRYMMFERGNWTSWVRGQNFPGQQEKKNYFRMLFANLVYVLFGRITKLHAIEWVARSLLLLLKAKEMGKFVVHARGSE